MRRFSTLCVPFVLLACLLYCRAAARDAQGTFTGDDESPVVVLDVLSLFRTYDPFKARMEKIKGEVTEYEHSLRHQRERLKEMTEEMDRLTKGTNEYNQLHQRIAHRSENLDAEVQQKRDEILRKEADTYADAYAKIVHVVASYARAHKIRLVLRYSSEPIDSDDRDSVLRGVNRAIIYQDRLDITDDIIRLLNSEA